MGSVNHHFFKNSLQTLAMDAYLFLLRVKYILAGLLMVVGCLPIKAQILRGSVKDGATDVLLTAVKITNERTQQSVYTDTKGNYSLSAEKGDPVLFSLVGYQEQSYIVPASMGVAEMFISLFQLSYDLEEFTLRNRFTAYQRDSMERRSTYQRALARRKGGGLMSPVSFVAEKLSGRSKRTFQFQKDFHHWEQEKFIDSRYTPSLVQSQTHLTGDSIAHFMNSHPMPFDFARAASDLELKVWVREQYKAWLQADNDSTASKSRPR